MTLERRSGPEPEPETAETQLPAVASNSLPCATDAHHLQLDPIDAAGVVDGVFALVVKVDSDHYRRRAFLTLKAAERAVERARTRGQGAEVVLCRLAPVIPVRGAR